MEHQEKLVALTQIKGKAAGVTQYLTHKAYLRAKKDGKLKDFVLADEIESIEIVNEKVEDLNFDEATDSLNFDEAIHYTQEILDEKKTFELKEILTSKKILFPKGVVKKQLLIDLILNNI